MLQIYRIMIMLPTLFALFTLLGCGESGPIKQPEATEHSQMKPSAEESSHLTGKIETPAQSNSSINDSSPLLTPEAAPSDQPALPTEPPVVSGTLIAVGDIMMHQPQIEDGYDSDTGAYSFDHVFSLVSPVLSQGDWVLGNLETTFAGPDQPYTGYPQFKAPDALADAIKASGIKIVTTANNHSLDSYEAGLLRTLDVLNERELHAVGTYASEEAALQPLLIEANGIRMAFLAYTYGTNGIPIPKGKDYLVNLIDFEKMAEDIARARNEGADVVTVGLHMGPQEYHRQPSDNQKQNVEQAIEAGADIILGGHPHVVQPYAMFETRSAMSKLPQGVVIYSLGNFVSGQVGDFKDYGVIFSVELEKNSVNDSVTITGVNSLPTYVHRQPQLAKRHYRVLPVEQVLNERNDPYVTAQEYNQMEAAYTDLSRHIGSLTIPVDTLPNK